jgi:hypothetical protein
MELDQWLAVYQAISVAASSKERSLWSIFSGGLIAECVFVLVLIFLAPAPLDTISSKLEIATTVVGLLLSLMWLLLLVRMSCEAQYMERLLRNVESQFAGGEFHRSLHRLSRGEQVCVAASTWTCGEWYPAVSRLPFAARVSARVVGGLLALVFLIGWIAVLVEIVAF